MPASLLTSPLGTLLARAGGGQGFNPGGGGGGGGSSGGSGGSGFFLLSLLLLGHGAGFGVLLVLVIGYMLMSRFTNLPGLNNTRGSGSGPGWGSAPPIPPAAGPSGQAQPNPAAYGAGSFNPAAPGGANPGRAGGGPGGWDDTHPIGVPASIRGAMLDGSDPAATVASGAEAGRDDGIAAITAHDSAFDPPAFLSQAQTAFFVIQEAWSDVKPELSRSVMADGLAQQFAFQMDEYRRKNQRNMLDGLTVGHADIVGAHSDSSFDTVTVRFQAASADYDVDAGSGHVVRGHRDVEPWTEDWIFQRSSQATTTPGKGTMNRKCPNCQAPISISAEGTCEYCHAPVMSGKYDWVLARIDQVPVYSY